MIAGTIGITLSITWAEPRDHNNPSDVDASERAMQFMGGWFANPIVYGDYPDVMKQYIGRKSKEQNLPSSRLPVFTEEEKNYIRGTFGRFTNAFCKTNLFCLRLYWWIVYNLATLNTNHYPLKINKSKYFGDQTLRKRFIG